MPEPGKQSEAPRSRRDRPAKSPLSQEAIVEAALTLLEHEGAESVSMRRVARELDTGPASLYVYVDNRQHLLELVYDTVVSNITVPEAGDWQDRLTGLLLNSVAEIGKYRSLALTTLGTISTGPHAMELLEQVAGLLHEGGLDEATIAWALDLLALLVTASAVEQSIFGDQLAEGDQIDDMVHRVNSAFAALPKDQFPNIQSLLPFMMLGTGDERFSWWIQVVLNGLATAKPPAVFPSRLVPSETGRDGTKDDERYRHQGEQGEQRRWPAQPKDLSYQEPDQRPK